MRETIALAGAGDLGRYVCEELLKSELFSVVILTRSVENKWFKSYPVQVHQTDYSAPSILKILDETQASTLLSFVNGLDSSFVTVHAAMLDACKKSRLCKRLIPSEFIGDSEAFPLKPDFYATTRFPFREMLKAQSEVEWTLFNCGWIMDYFLPSSKIYMKPIKEMFPVDPDAWTACIRGTGKELQSWTSARDIGRALVRLCATRDPAWEPWIFTAGQWGCFDETVKIMEDAYGRPMSKTYKSIADIQDVLAQHAGEDPMSEELELAQVEEMMVMGSLACPRDKTLRHREKYFKSIEFMGLKELLEHTE